VGRTLFADKREKIFAICCGVKTRWHQKEGCHLNSLTSSLILLPKLVLLCDQWTLQFDKHPVGTFSASLTVAFVVSSTSGPSPFEEQIHVVILSGYQQLVFLELLQ